MASVLDATRKLGVNILALLYVASLLRIWELTMKPKLLLCLALVLSGGLFAGCGLMVENMPSQKGTWIGIATPVTLYDAKRMPHDALQLVIQEGPAYWGDGPLKGQFILPKAVIVDKKYYTVDVKQYEGRRLKIRGEVEIAEVIDSKDGTILMWTTPKFDDEHTNPPGVIRASRIDIIGSTNAPSSNQP